MTAHRTLTGLLRSTTFSHVYGEKTPIGIFPSLSKDQFIQRYNAGWFSGLSNEDFERHQHGDDTFYFFGTPKVKDEFTLVMGDIDVKKAKGLGSPQGALNFAQHLKTTFWPDLYFEPSTHGKGIHFYTLMKKTEVGAQSVNQAIDSLEGFLRHQAELVGADIELVEVKGKCPVIVYDDYGRITEVKYGTFAKYPRNATLEDLQNTTIIDWQELCRINGKYAVGKYAVKVEKPTLHSGSCSTSAPEGKYAVPAAVKKPKLHVGSGSTSIPDEFVAEHLDSCLKAWLNLTGGEIIKGKRYVVAAEDAAVVMLIALWLKEHGTKDSRHSVRTTLAFWDDLQSRGLTDRSPNHHRIKSIRNYLSSRGCVDWLDNKYQPPSGKGAKDGICCKWRLDEFFAILLMAGGDNVGSEFRGEGENLRPQMRFLREEAEWCKESLFWEAADREIEAIFQKAA